MQTESLSMTIEQLYQTFAHYSIPNYPTGCPCCTSPDAHYRLLAKPLRQLSAADLWPYSMRALTTWGDDQQFRALLPRLFELLAANPSCFLIENVFGKLAYAEWQTWPANQQAPIQHYFSRLWQQSLADADYPLSALLAALARTGLDLAPFLAYWDAQLSTLSGLHHYAELIAEQMPSIIGQNRLHHFWSSPSSATTSLLAWLQNPARRQSFYTTFADSHDDQVIELLASILQWDDLLPDGESTPLNPDPA